MTVVFGVDFATLSPALATALRAVDVPKLTLGSRNGETDAWLIEVADDVQGSVAAALTESEGSGAEIVAVGPEDAEADALDSGAADFVAFPSASFSAKLAAAARRLRRARQQRVDYERLRRLDAIRLRIAESDADLDTLTQAVCDQLLADRDLHALTRADGAIVEFIHDDRLVYHAAAGSVATYKGVTMALQGTLSKRALDSGELLVADDTQADPRVDAEACRQAGIRSLAVAPLVVDGRPSGNLKLISLQPHTFTAVDRRILGSIAEMVAAAIARERGRERLRTLAATDPLTGLLNRREFVAAADRSLQRAGGRNIAVLMLDLDEFKAINDAHGHAAGDTVLIEVARLIGSTLRTGDIVGRIGGEEFAIVLPRVEEEQALAAAERIRAAIEASKVVSDGVTLGTTASIGVAMINEPVGQEQAFRRADSALYRAKALGRNRVVLHHDADVLSFPGRAKG